MDKNLKESHTIQEHYEVVDESSFSEMQKWLMTLSLIFSTDLLRLKESLCLIVFGVAGTGKSYLINAIRNLLQGKCTVTATTGKAAYNISDSAFFFNCLLGLEVKKILQVRACAGCRKI